MSHGNDIKLLRVDLSRGAVRSERIDPEAYRMLPGGKGLAASLLLREVAPGIDPLGSDNVLILAAGLLTGVPFSTSTRFSAVAKSPLTGGYGESEAGGFWGPELKMAGHEAIVITGRAPHPVYLAIRDDQVEVRDARHLWGREPEEVQEAIRAEMDERLARVLQIGAGGENLVRFACLTNELRHYNGRSGMGAVMGSKNVKAVAVRGTGRYVDKAFDGAQLAEFGKILAKRVKQHPAAWDLQEKGTPGLVDGLNAGGIMPTRNFREGAFVGFDGLRWQVYEQDLLSGRRTCYACAVRCKREVKVADRYAVTDAYGGPEYETIGGLGSVCGIGDLQAVAKGNELCARYTLDTISTGATIAFAMECFEKGLLTAADTGGIELRFGNAEAVLKMIELIAHRRGFGDLLAEGSLRAARRIGRGAEKFAMQIKGQELPMHEPRGKPGMGLGYAVNESGADHLASFHDPTVAKAESAGFKGAKELGVQEAVPTRELSPRKAEVYGRLENWSSFEKVVGLCYFGPTPRSFIAVDEVLAAVHAASGWDVTVEELLAIGERATNLARMFNVREGFSRADDTLPDRIFEPLESGALQGVALSRADFEESLTALYRLKGWNPETAAPTPEKLEQLGIGWAAEFLA
jgi:aldehyde:ferredoxin oxidoreductase